MKLESFLAALLPQDGVFALFNTNTKQHLFYGTHDDLVVALEARVHQPNWFFCTASLTAQQRLQDNVQAKRALYIDIDCGADKHAKDPENTYETQPEGKADLVRFAQVSGLNPTLIVDSGAGLHAYWALDEDIDAAHWLSLAKMLKAACAKLGLRIDNACTTDSVRVLRPIGALHYSGKRVRALYRGPVWSPDGLRSKLAEYAEVPAPKRAQKLNVSSDVFASGPPPKFLRIVENCPAAAFALDNQEQVPEPLWRMMLGLTKHTAEAEKAAHAISREHPEFDEELMTEKYEAWKVGPPTCEKIADHCKACGTCEHKGKITSPISLGRPSRVEVEQAEAASTPTLESTDTEVETLPEGYPSALLGILPPFCFNPKFPIYKNGSGHWGLYAMVPDDPNDKNSTMTAKLLCQKVFWIEGVSSAGTRDNEGSMATLAVYHKGAVTKFLYDQKLVANATELMTYMADKGVLLADIHQRTKNLGHDYMHNQIIRAQLMAERAVIRRTFGFMKDADGKLAFALGRQLIKADGSITDAMVGKDMAGVDLGVLGLPSNPLFSWGPEIWDSHILPGARQQAEYFKQVYPAQPPLQLGILMAISAPLMMFVTDDEWTQQGAAPRFGCVAALYSRASGLGKTTSMTDAARCFGSSSYVIRGGKTDNTPKALITQIAMRSTLPVFLDEVTDLEAKPLGELINTISGGFDRIRLDQKGNLANEVRTWANVTIMSTNRSQREMLNAVGQTDAKQMRLLEIPCDNLPRLSPEVLAGLDEKRRTLLNPYQGCLGAALANFCVTRGYDEMRRRGTDISAAAIKSIPDPMQGRFFARSWACVALAADILKELGLMPFDEKKILKEFLMAVKSAVSFVHDQSSSKPSIALRELLSAMAPAMLLTTSDAHGAQKDLVMNMTPVRLPLKARYVLAGNFSYVSTKSARDWCVENGMSLHQLLDEWEAMGLLLPVDKSQKATLNLSRGTTGYAHQTAEVFAVSHAALDNYLGSTSSGVGTLARPAAEVVPINRATQS